MRKVGLAAFTLLFAMSGTASPAAGSTPRRLAVLSAQAFLYGDGTRWVAWPDGESVSVYDGNARRLSRFAFPGPKCAVLAVGAGHVAIGCQEAAGQRRSLIRDLASGRTVTIGNAATRRAIAHVTFDQLGKVWLGGFREQRNSPPIETFVNWHTGEVRRGGRRKIIPENQTPDGFILAPEPIPSHDLDSPRLSLTPSPATYVLQGGRRCGLFLHRRSRSDATLVSCQPPRTWSWIALSPGLVTWQSDQGADGYALATGRRFSWRFPDLDLQLAPSQDTIVTAHTRSEVLFSVAHYGANAMRSFGVYVASWQR